MLKGKRSVSACSLSSCRIKAEALARAFNNRILPCVWMTHSRSSSAEREGDGMPNGIDDDEEFFDASPSPVEDESLFCQQHSSAATEAGRAKLYELLQQHVAADDAIDVFYDVSEDAGPTDTCLKDRVEESADDEEACQSSKCCGHQLGDESYFSNNSESNGKDSDATLFQNSRSVDKPGESDIRDSLDSLLDGKCQLTSPCTSEEEQSITSNLICDVFHDNTTITEIQNTGDPSQEVAINENYVLEQDKNEAELEEISLSVEHVDTRKVLTEEDSFSNEIKENEIEHESTEIADSPSVDFNSEKLVVEEINLDGKDEREEVPVSLNECEITENGSENKSVVEIITESPSPTSESSSSKTSSPTTSRLTIFDQLRPKISRSTSLKTGKTPPGTPSKKKIVRFADVLGLDLEDVRHIMSGDLPNIPSSAYVDLDLKDDDLPKCETISETLEVSRRNSSCWKTVQGATATNVLYPTFAIPGEQPDFMDRVRFQGICLETAVVSEMSVQCTCRVMNYGFHKKVTARYTVNDWLSSTDINAAYVLGSSNGETDKFSFSIFLSPLNRSLQFALKYDVNKKEYWDNNRNQNYCFRFHYGHDQMQTYDHILPSSSWQHQFW